ncbi:MAG: heat-inducible transcriptional repressor HrcA [Chitinispirillaceae bacterium]|nr:heat-inducible transcriptional repressor HrcA [Chitinispirillaceae bacterium]
MEREGLLSERESKILEAIVQNYILRAKPTSSRYLSKHSGFNLCSASIRNIMADLAERGFITHPHISAGRIPTDYGYRYYVDRIMSYTELPEEIKENIKNTLINVDPSDIHQLLETASKALSQVTKQLGVIIAPKIENAILSEIYIFNVGEKKFILNVAFKQGFIKSLLLEFESAIPYEQLEKASRILTAKFTGRRVAELLASEENLYSEIREIEPKTIRLLIPSLRKMVQENSEAEIFTEGETNVLLQPEFSDRKQISMIVEILEEKKLLMHLFQPEQDEDDVVVKIGNENKQEILSYFSIIKTKYRMGNMIGSLGIIGPKRMPYPLLISAVKYTADLLGRIMC